MNGFTGADIQTLIRESMISNIYSEILEES